MRLAASKRREVRLRNALLTAYVDSGDEYFDDSPESRVAAVRRFPLTCLEDCAVNNVQLSSALSAGFICIQASLLDVVLSYLVKPCCDHGLVSECAIQKCGITRLQANDYVVEEHWRKYSWQGIEWLYNSRTEDYFYPHHTPLWRAYRYKNAVWWLYGKRCFWEVHG